MEKGGFREALKQAGVCRGMAVHFPDEMRLGLRGQVRRVLAPRGVKVRQKLQLRYVWRYLVVAVDPRQATVHWQWTERMSAQALAPLFEAWKLSCVVWDGAPAHRSGRMAEVPMKRIPQPAYSPELNPAERIIEEVRRHTEGVVYASIEEKQQAAERYLRGLQRDPEQVQRLCGWAWIEEALADLPPAPR